MELIKVSRASLPVLSRDAISVSTVEKLFLKIPYGIVFIEGEKGLEGYFDIQNWRKNSDPEQNLIRMENPCKNLEDITEKMLAASPLVPVVNEDDRIVCAYYSAVEQKNVDSYILARLLDLQRMQYDFRHYLDKSRCSGKKVAIFTDFHRVKSSLALGQMFCEYPEDVKFEGVFIYQGYKSLFNDNAYNMDCDLYFICTLYEIMARGVDIIYFNTQAYTKAAGIERLRRAGISCRDMVRHVKLLKNKCLTDWSIIRYKHKLAQKGIKFLTMSLPRAYEINYPDNCGEDPELMEFLCNNVGTENAEDFNQMRLEFVKNQVKDGSLHYYNDVKSEYFNVIAKCRYVTDQPLEYDRTLYLVGPCIVAGLYVKDSDTLGSLLQRMFLDKGEKVRVVALPISTEAMREYYLQTVLSLNPEKGDTIVLIDQSYLFLRSDIDGRETCEAAVRQYGRAIFKEIPMHCNVQMMRAVAERLFRELDRDWGKSEEYDQDYQRYMENLSEYHSRSSVDILENHAELAQYKTFLRENSITPKIVNGAIVMNCNPFTLGHQYLIEYAASKVDYLYIFVVQEDKSFFKFKDRLRLVEAGTAHLKNVKVVPSGKFIISSTTFSEYFDKANLKGTTVDTSQDVEIFGKHIAPVLDISVRFVGEEPLDPVTNQYNQSMKKILPKYGVTLCEIPRKESGDNVISASRVRACLKAGQWDQIKELVPATTYQFLEEQYK